MRTRATFFGLVSVVLTLTLPPALGAEVVLRPTGAPDARLSARLAAEATGRIGAKLDPEARGLFVPRYEVDTTSPVGTTTLFAVRNTTPAPLNIQVVYISLTGELLLTHIVPLDPLETITRNLRDVPGLPVDPDGFARGYVLAYYPSDGGERVLVGDYLQVDVGDNFATGDRMVALHDLCAEAEVRFFDFGSGTDLQVILEPLGADPDTDPPSIVIDVLDESGGVVGGVEVYTDQVSLALSSTELTELDFGTFVFHFTAGAGWIAGEYSAEGTFSVGINGACKP